MNLNSTICVLAGGIGVFVLGVLILRMARKMAVLLLIAGALGVAGSIAWALAAQASATRRVAEVAEVQAVTNAGLSAAVSVTLFLLILILVLILAVTGAVAAWLWWQKRQKQAQWQEALRQAQLYAILSGGSPPAHRQVPSYPAHQGMGGPVIVFPGQQHPQVPPPAGISLEDLARALQAAQGQPDPLAGLLPPDEWEVLE
jgi:hypothetical protein